MIDCVLYHYVLQQHVCFRINKKHVSPCSVSASRDSISKVGRYVSLSACAFTGADGEISNHAWRPSLGQGQGQDQDLELLGDRLNIESVGTRSGLPDPGFSPLADDGWQAGYMYIYIYIYIYVYRERERGNILNNTG